MEINPMTFEGGIARFVCKSANGICWPIGPPTKIVVNNEVIIKGAGFAQFENGRWGTPDPEYAKGMMTQPHFLDPDGWQLDPACLPKSILPFWGPLKREARKKIALALVAGDDPAKILTTLSDAELEVIRTPPPKVEIKPMEFPCPVPDCGLRVEGISDEHVAKAALLDHVRLIHPEWRE